MSTFRKILLIVMAAGMLAAIVLTWGSIGSIVLALGLILMVLSLLHQRFLINQDDDYFLE